MSILDESTLSLGEATKIIPGSPHISTVWRWTRRGVRGVLLETFSVGGKRFTSVEAVRRFLVASQQSVSEAAEPTKIVASSAAVLKRARIAR
jgi:hypothetical protein